MYSLAILYCSFRSNITVTSDRRKLNESSTPHATSVAPWRSQFKSGRTPSTSAPLPPHTERTAVSSDQVPSRGHVADAEGGYASRPCSGRGTGGPIASLLYGGGLALAFRGGTRQGRAGRLAAVPRSVAFTASNLAVGLEQSVPSSRTNDLTARKPPSQVVVNCLKEKKTPRSDGGFAPSGTVGGAESGLGGQEGTPFKSRHCTLFWTRICDVALQPDGYAVPARWGCWGGGGVDPEPRS